MCFELTDAAQSDASTPHRPGTWVLMVGPSGAGKDTVMRHAKHMLSNRPHVLFAKRVVTRSENAFEDHDTATEAEFLAMREAGQFVLTWQAHGLYYGIHERWNDKVQQGCIVVCNVSRTMIAYAKQNLGAVAVVLVTASQEVLAQRIAARGRDKAVGSRTSRDLEETSTGQADIIIHNVGPPETGGGQLADFLKSLDN